MAVPTIIATPQPVAGNVVVTVNWAALPSVDFARVIRVYADGSEVVLRTNTSSDPTGQYMELSGGLAVFYDSESPLDVSLTYRTEGLGSTATATSSEVILQSGGNIWLRDPLYPANGRRIVLGTGAGLPECKPGDGIFFRSMDTEVRPGQTTNVAVNGSSQPTPLVRVRGSATSTLNLVCRTFDDRDLMIATLAPGTVLLLDIPTAYGYDQRYISVGDVPDSRVSRDYKRQWSFMSLPYVVVGAPSGMSYGVLGNRWMDLCVANSGLYATFGDATAAGVSWTTLVYGGGSTVAPRVAYRTWAQVLTDFATWSAVNSGGRTWEDLLEGR